MRCGRFYNPKSDSLLHKRTEASMLGLGKGKRGFAKCAFSCRPAHQPLGPTAARAAVRLATVKQDPITAEPEIQL